MTPQEFPKDIKEWLNHRGISDEVLFHNNISVVNRQIVIPVYSPSGEFLFNKYRRDPFSAEGPKYKYDKGATSALYGVYGNMLTDTRVIVVEGELDALCLQSKGYFAVSTTGGAGTFKEEWAVHFEGKEVFICYDNDQAGIDGTIKLLGIFPNARVILLPRTSGAKDVTDFLQRHALSVFTHFVTDAREWPLPKTKEECRDAAELFEGEKQSLLRDGRDTEFVDALLKKVSSLYDSFNTKPKRPTIRDGDALERARSVPIDNFIKFDSQKNALCINHPDKHPSMHWFKKNNKVKCFVCGYNGDAVDVVQKLHGLSVGEAIKKINEP